MNTGTIKQTSISIFLIGSAMACSAAVITQGGSDIVAFEAEIAAIDNTFDDPGLGWIQEVNSGASGGIDMVSNENNTVSPANNELIYTIDFDKTGSYAVWGRLQASTRTDLEDTRTQPANNDSFYLENGTIGNQSSYSTENSIGLSAGWAWFNLETITVGATGDTDWHVSNREDGTMIDRFIFQHADDSTPSSSFDTLENSLDGGFGGRVPEPSTAAMYVVGVTVLSALRRRTVKYA